jgi:diguanylate cyclase (GGDEF)-like protein
LATLVAVFAVNVMPALGLAIATRVRTPAMLETLIVVAISFGIITRLGLLSLHPDLGAMWPALMLGLVFVIYLFLPVRLMTSVALASGFSVVAPACWVWAQAGVLQPDQFGRGLICVMLANALGFVAANSLHRSQRTQFAQRLVMQQLLSTDAMTGIANRRRFDAALDREWRRCRRARTPLSILMIDVDHFKAYNDYCGHPQGDACLRQVAQVLVEAVGRPGDLAARYGGEEFVCLLPEVSAAGALTVAERLMAALRQANIVHPRSLAGPRLTISIGVATAEALTGEAERLVEFADQLLYAAKRAGRNQVHTGQLTPERETRAA